MIKKEERRMNNTSNNQTNKDQLEDNTKGRGREKRQKNMKINDD